MRLPAFKPELAVRLDLILEHDMAIYGERIFTFSSALYMNINDYRKLNIVDMDNDPLLKSICLLSMHQEYFDIINPFNSKRLKFICYTYLNAGSTRINDSRKKVIRYINAIN